MTDKIKMILDVDTGIDDAIGIVLAATAPEVTLLGITTVSGNIDLESATKNTLRVLDLIDVTTVPVHMGAAKPLKRSIRYATEVHGASGMAGQLEDVAVALPTGKDAVSFIIEQLEAHKGEVTLVMTGPQTNFALALEREPRVAQWVKNIVIMGGVVLGRGNESPVAEFNIAIDPEAVDKTFNCGAQVTMIGLDVTKKAILTKAHLEALDASKPLTQFVKGVTKQYMDRYFMDDGIYGCPMHDPLAVAVAITPDLVKTQRHFVAVEQNSTYCDGQTICDFNGKWGKTPNVDVALEVDDHAFLSLLIDRLKTAGVPRGGLK